MLTFIVFVASQGVSLMRRLYYKEFTTRKCCCVCYITGLK